MLTTVSPERGGLVKARPTAPRHDRFERAEQLASECATWLKLNRKVTLDPRRHPYLVVPGWPDRAGNRHLHETTLLYCTCRFRQYARIDDACVHMLAVRLWWARYRSGLVEVPRLKDEDWAIFDAEAEQLCARTERLLAEYGQSVAPQSAAIEPARPGPRS